MDDRPRWRLLLDGACDGRRNMAVDEALLRSRAHGGPATLRLYRWQRPTVSLGRFQRLSDVDLGACERFGVDVVRRVTGGRGVLHDDELTYSVVAAEVDGLPRGVSASYRYLGAALLRAYALLGVDAEIAAGSAKGKGNGACYLASTQADLSLAGSKLSGSAQVWRDGACLQHGSFVVSRDVAREAAVFHLDAEAEDVLARSTVTIESCTGERPSEEALVRAAIDGFEEALGIALEPGDPNSEERADAERLEAAATLEDVRVRA